MQQSTPGYVPPNNPGGWQTGSSTYAGGPGFQQNPHGNTAPVNTGAPYGQPNAPIGWYPQKPPKQSHTLRNVLLAIIAVCVLGMAGCTALVVGGAAKVASDIDSHASAAGGSKNPLQITAGQSFSVRGFDYSPGWSVGTNSLGFVAVDGLKVTNNRGKKDSALVTINLMKDTEVLASLDCTTQPILEGQTVTLNCFGSDKAPAEYSSITINDTF